MLCFVPHFFFVFAVEDLEFVFLQALDCNDLRDWFLLVFAAPEEVAWDEGGEETLAFLRLTVAQIKAVNTKNAVLGPVLLVILDDLPLLEIRSRHQPIEEIFL